MVLNLRCNQIIRVIRKSFTSCFGMPTGDAYSSGHLVPSLWDLHMFYFLRPILFRTCRYFTGLCYSNIPRYFLDFAWFSLYGLTGYHAFSEMQFNYNYKMLQSSTNSRYGLKQRQGTASSSTNSS